MQSGASDEEEEGGAATLPPSLKQAKRRVVVHPDPGGSTKEAIWCHPGKIGPAKAEEVSKGLLALFGKRLPGPRPHIGKMRQTACCEIGNRHGLGAKESAVFPAPLDECQPCRDPALEVMAVLSPPVNLKQHRQETLMLTCLEQFKVEPGIRHDLDLSSSSILNGDEGCLPLERVLSLDVREPRVILLSAKIFCRDQEAGEGEGVQTLVVADGFCVCGAEVPVNFHALLLQKGAATSPKRVDFLCVARACMRQGEAKEILPVCVIFATGEGLEHPANIIGRGGREEQAGDVCRRDVAVEMHGPQNFLML
jgi:hypothetical protein